jgi:hypothetical protein
MVIPIPLFIIACVGASMIGFLVGRASVAGGEGGGPP